jgi:hypothetical protein
MAAILLGYNGPVKDGERVFAPARQFGKPAADLVAPMPYAARQSMLDVPNAQHGLHRYWRSAFTDRISDDLINVMVRVQRSSARRLAPSSSFTCTVPSRACRRTPLRSGRESRSGSNRHIRSGGNSSPTSRAAPTSIISRPTTGREKIRASFGTNYQRLRQIKARYNGANLFRVNFNIAPA